MFNMQDIFDGECDDGFTEEVQRLIFFETIDNHGRAQYTVRKSNIRCVVTTPSDSEVKRYVDSTTYSKVKCFTGIVNVNPDTVFTDSDEIVWRGDHYKILGQDDYPQNGFTRSIGAMIEFNQSRVNKK